MNIITGKYRGRKLVSPKNDARPTLGRAKETLFNTIQFDIQGRRTLDLFAGSGALGLEAASRGASEVVFVDIDPLSISAIKQNCSSMGLDAKILRSSYDGAINSGVSGKFDLVFIDPPFGSSLCEAAVTALVNTGRLNAGAIIVCEHGFNSPMPENIGHLSVYKVKKVGNIGFTFYTDAEKSGS